MLAFNASVLAATVDRSYTAFVLKFYALPASWGNVLTSFKISLSLSPTTVRALSDIHFRGFGMAADTFALSGEIHTCPAVVPVHSDRPLKRALVRLELSERITGASRILDHAACVRWSEIFQNAVDLILGGSALLNLFT